MNKNYLVSIIVPIYNVEKYLNKCLESIISQKYKNLEILLINDGSTDNSEKIIKKFLKKDNRIKYFCKENGGLSSARNFGLEHCSGDYICFVDGDDWINIDYVLKNIKTIDCYNCDMVISNISYIYNDGSTKRRVPKIKRKKIINRKQAIKKLLNGKSYKFHIVNKFCKKEIYDKKNIKFPCGKIYEDMFTSYKLFVNSSKIALIPDNLYYYLQNRPGSILNTVFKENRFDVLEAIDEIINNKVIKTNTNKLDKQNFYVLNILSLISYLVYVSDAKTLKGYLMRIKNDKNNCLCNFFLLNFKIKLLDKIKFTLFKLNPFFYLSLLKKIKKIG